MGAFLICKKRTVSDSKIQGALSLFYRRGFKKATRIETSLFELYIFPKLNGKPISYARDQEGNFIIITGTLLYEPYPKDNAAQILNDILNNTFNPQQAKGAFVIIYYTIHKNILEIIQDETCLYRFYKTLDGRIITSSFLSAFYFSEKNISTSSLIFNLITGYQPERNTWAEDIKRVFPGDFLIEDVNSIKYSTNTYSTNTQSTSSFLLERLKFIIDSGFDEYFLGLSAGYDSRLMLSILHKNGLQNLKLFTYHKHNDPDLIYSKSLASEVGLPIEIIEPTRGALSQENLYEKCFLFFDGGVHAMMQYSKEEYSLDFRHKLFPAKDILQVSGVGGEIYRNYNHDPKGKMNIDSWIIATISPWIWQSIHSDYKKAFLLHIKDFLIDNLQIRTEQIDFLTRKKYYAEVYLRDWHSLRNSTENQFANYLSPFINKEQIQSSYTYVNKHGYGGKYEASIISSISPALAKIKSNYGFSFEEYSQKQFISDFFKAFSNKPIFSPVKGTYSAYKMNKKKVILTDFERNLIHYIKQLHLPLDIDNLMKQGEKKEQILSTAYSLQQLLSL